MTPSTLLRYFAVSIILLVFAIIATYIAGHVYAAVNLVYLLVMFVLLSTAIILGSISFHYPKIMLIVGLSLATLRVVGMPTTSLNLIDYLVFAPIFFLSVFKLSLVLFPEKDKENVS